MPVLSSPQHRPHRGTPSAHPRAGFTLIEVTVAIGIVAFAFVAIFSLLPVGMTNFRRSLDTSLTTQIATRIINDLKQSDFDTVKTTTLNKRYFTEQGDEVAGTDEKGNPKTPTDPWLYYGEVTVVQPAATALPGAATPPSVNLLTVIIRLAANPGKKASPFATNSKVPYRTFTTLIARNQ